LRISFGDLASFRQWEGRRESDSLFMQTIWPKPVSQPSIAQPRSRQAYNLSGNTLTYRNGQVILRATGLGQNGQGSIYHLCHDQAAALHPSIEN
jgi:hypothetical protein